ncbi:hypothetical protein BST81_08780 [Leptolyngbya sp. 'hensonii']|uniref:L,D-transpeptidase n=1 Tax=Leptolyngbya sp. 'hensonii' TaxID=1922337 RepID=UPI00094FB41A|nr:L,D-transpeptidase [Leptolyngbya sp. 'hensonii']OLP18820.1 hypothetical protein BST81_08780 [Leptolyngbya sp. 'hensonii']
MQKGLSTLICVTCLSGVAVVGMMGEAKAVEMVAKISERQLYVYSDSGQLIRKFDIAVARPGKVTPLGNFRVQDKAVWPAWYPPSGGGVVPGGPGNPLGERWIGFNGEYGIHGTNNQASVGKAASSGCFRMRSKDIIALYDLVKVGDRITVVR